MPFVSEHNIARVSFLYAIILVGVITFSTGALFIVRKVENLKTEQALLEQEFINEQKSLLKNDVLSLIDRISDRNSDMLTFLEQTLKDRVEEAGDVAVNLYTQLQDRATKDEIREIIRESIRPMHITRKHSYFFILETSGMGILYPANPDLEGTNLKYTMLNSEKIVDNLIAIATEHGSGIYGYNWYKPDYESDKLYPKISYVTLVEELNWVIGSGEYLDNLQDLAKEEITKELEGSLNSDNPDYFFIYDLHDIQGGTDFATILINSNRPDLVGRKISDDYRDHNGKQFRKEFMKGIRKYGEAYSVYSYKKPTGGYGRKLSYFKLYPRWNWIVARGIYFDRLDTLLATQKSALRTKVKHDIIILILFFIAAVSIALIVAYHFSNQLQDIFNRYRIKQQENLAQLKELNTILDKQSRTDALTGIYNRTHLSEKLTEEVERANRYSGLLSIILLDIDNFKSINDTFGHPEGDSVLRDFSSLIQDNIRKSDTFARWGGEEFIILTPGITSEQAVMMAEKLRKLIEHHTFSIGRKVTASFGISSYKKGENSDRTIKRADEALYKAKESGRNRVIRFGTLVK